jgi:hypothetical protein
MSEFTCPKCHADIQADLLETTGRAECPFCSANLSGLGLPERAQAGTASDNLDDTFDESGEVTRGFPSVPDKSQIKVIEANDNRLVFYIPGGGKQTAGLGCFAVAWNGFMCLFTPPWLIGMGQQGNDAPPLFFIIPFLGLFWAIGLGMGFVWLKMKYQRTILLLQRDRLVMQKVLFKWKRVTETALTRESRAELVESYQQNDVPVYRIEVQGLSNSAQLGTPLSDAEKDWLVDRINEFLDVEALPVVSSAGLETVGRPDGSAGEQESEAVAVIPETCRKCGAPLSGSLVGGSLTCGHCGAVVRMEILVPARAIAEKRYERMTPGTLPPDSRITIDEDSDEALQFHYPAVGHPVMRWVVPIFTILFSLMWYGFFINFIGVAWQMPMGAMSVVFTLFAIPFLIVGLFPLGFGLIAFRGHTTVRLTRETLSCRWHVANLGRSKRVETSAIDDIRVENASSMVGQNPRIRVAKPPGAAAVHMGVCLVRAGSQYVLLTIFQEEPVSWQVASLLRTRLLDMGHSLKP